MCESVTKIHYVDGRDKREIAIWMACTLILNSIWMAGTKISEKYIAFTLQNNTSNNNICVSDIYNPYIQLMI